MDQYIEFLGNHYMLTAAWIVLFFLFITSFVGAAMSKVKLVSTHDMTLLVNRENAKVVDTRAAADFNKGHITDAINLTLDKITTEQFGALEKHKSDPIIVVCNAGISAKTAAKQLTKSGFENVSVLQGGMQTWTSANLPIVKS
ncbi:MAG: rhodanese-like domain-containing protein [Gammaproteobacteria bacterium]|nr:rhodanese-like domain-containing protein [Gammaproteobacteria bacterium]